uniref:Uncharacterized protein n=1 Tax=Spironucleus salmonicida TaxID=348837 RepID=V6M1H1_9EUKA|eukprot:EST41741.1 Hypothetical protein SS50377_18827 [Spironucleus salmonicida]
MGLLYQIQYFPRWFKHREFLPPERCNQVHLFHLLGLIHSLEIWLCQARLVQPVLILPQESLPTVRLVHQPQTIWVVVQLFTSLQILLIQKQSPSGALTLSWQDNQRLLIKLYSWVSQQSLVTLWWQEVRIVRQQWHREQFSDE